MLQKTHRFIAKQVVDAAIISIGKFGRDLVLGCEYEDYSFRILGYHHFYNPENHEGFSKSVESAKQKGIALFEEAIQLYKRGRTKQAYYTLGRSFHYLADVASPAHTKMIYHLGEDDFEVYTDSYLARFKLNIKLKLVPPMTPNHCFDALAKRSFNLDYRKTTPMIGFITNLFLRPKVKQTIGMDKNSQAMLESSMVYTMSMFRYFDLRIAANAVVVGTSDRMEEAANIIGNLLGRGQCDSPVPVQTIMGK